MGGYVWLSGLLVGQGSLIIMIKLPLCENKGWDSSDTLSRDKILSICDLWGNIPYCFKRNPIIGRFLLCYQSLSRLKFDFKPRMIDFV